MAPTGQASKANEQQEKQQPTFKEQLDQAAYDARHPEGKDEKPSVIGKGIEKVTEYVPAAAKIIGTGSRDKAHENAPAQGVPGPPDRPQHDERIEEFIQDQYRSKQPDIDHSK